MNTGLISVCVTKKPVSLEQGARLFDYVEKQFPEIKSGMSNADEPLQRFIFLEWPVHTQIGFEFFLSEDIIQPRGTLCVMLHTQDQVEIDNTVQQRRYMQKGTGLLIPPAFIKENNKHVSIIGTRVFCKRLLTSFKEATSHSSSDVGNDIFPITRNDLEKVLSLIAGRGWIALQTSLNLRRKPVRGIVQLSQVGSPDTLLCLIAGITEQVRQKQH